MIEWRQGAMIGMEFSGPNELRWTRTEIPGEEPGSILVRVESLGICGTDVHLFTGSSAYITGGMTRYPFQPGHEFAGTVVAVGSEVRSVSVGDRVVGEPFLPCMVCAVCLAGHLNLCPNRAEQGVRGNIPGAAAQYVRVPAANVVQVPGSVAPEHALLAESSVTVLHSLAATGVQPGMRVAVIGSGTIGLIATQVAAHMGAEVDTIGVDAGLALAGECGAARLFSPDDVPSDTYDVVIEAAGAPSSLGLAIRIASPGARISQTSIPGRESTGVDAASIVAKGLTIVGILGGIPFLGRAVDLIAKKVIDPTVLIESVRSWDQAESAFADMIKGGLARPKIVLDLRDLELDSLIA